MCGGILNRMYVLRKTKKAKINFLKGIVAVVKLRLRPGGFGVTGVEKSASVGKLLKGSLEAFNSLPIE